MGPQPFGCGREEADTGGKKDSELQWGRNLSVAEGDETRGRRFVRCGASMGPQPFGCGRLVAIRNHIGPLNASMGPQPFGCGRLATRRSPIGKLNSLQWGRNLSVAEGKCVCKPNRPFGASMGPQPFGCGRPMIGVPACAVAVGFNGAATFRLRKGGGGGRRVGAGRSLQWGRNLSVAEGLS